MKHILRTALCAVLILVMAAGTCLSAFAAGEDLYVSEIRIEYGDAGKKALEDAGYTVQNYDLNKTAKFNNGDSQTSVWMGYKTTNNPDDAITDMGVIDMKGDYSFSNYEEVLKSQEAGVAKMTEMYMAAVNEFKANYAEGRASAKYAYELLNTFYEDDSEMRLGDFFLSAGQDGIQKMFLEGNTEILATAHQAIAVGLADTDDDNIFTRIEDLDIDDEDAYGKKLATVNRALFDEITQIQSYLSTFYKVIEESGEINSEYEFENYIAKNSDSIPESTLMNALKGYQIWMISNDVDYAGSGLTLLDIFLKDQSTLTDYYLNPLAAALTDGQAACFETAGLYQVLTVDAPGQDQYASKIDSVKDEFKGVDPLSVYTGIDRRIFEPDGIALMEEAAKASNNNSGSTWTKGDTYKSNEVPSWMITLYALTASISFISIVVMALTALNYKLSVAEVTISYAQSFSQCFLSGGAGQVFFTIVIALVLICIACILLTYVFGVFSEDKEVEQRVMDKRYDHSRKPEILVTHEEDVNGKEFYGYYYAVRKLDDSIADLNGGDTHNPEWNVMYTTKDKRLGDPIMAGSFKIQGKSDVPAGYSPVHNFTKNSEGIKPAANLNYGLAYATENIFMYAQHRAVGAAELTGSVFSNATVILIALAAFLVGGGLGGGIVSAKGRKKREQAA